MKFTYQEVIESNAATLLHTFEAELQVEGKLSASLLIRLNDVKPAQNLQGVRTTRYKYNK